MAYLQFVRFLLPLIFAMVAMELGGQILTGGMARVPRATETLAGFGLAWGLMSFLTSSLWQLRQVGLVMVDSRRALGRVYRFVACFSLLLAALMAGMALTPMGTWVIEDLHQVDRSLGAVVGHALLWLTPLPLLGGLTHLLAGVLMRVHRTEIVSAAALGSILTSILSVFLLLPLEVIQEQPIRLPVAVTYLGATVELVILLIGYARCARPALAPSGSLPRFAQLLGFFWPLALIMAVQGLSRPLINLFVARASGDTQALAVLTVVYALGHLPYSWLNLIRNLAPAFRELPDGLARIRKFASVCCLLSFGIAGSLFWTPLRPYILQDLIGVSASLSIRCAAPLVILSMFPFPVTVRAYFHGIGLLKRQTKAMAPSSLARIGAILLALAVLPALGIHGATRGVAALFLGFAAEAAAVWLGVRERNAPSAAQPSGPGQL
jgi:progressive ankylosis protein